MKEMLLWSCLRVSKNFLTYFSNLLFYNFGGGTWFSLISFLFILISDNWTPFLIVMAWTSSSFGYLQSLWGNEIIDASTWTWITDLTDRILTTSSFMIVIVKTCSHEFFSVSLGRITCVLLDKEVAIWPTWFSKILIEAC